MTLHKEDCHCRKALTGPWSKTLFTWRTLPESRSEQAAWCGSRGWRTLQYCLMSTGIRSLMPHGLTLSQQSLEKSPGLTSIHPNPEQLHLQKDKESILAESISQVINFLVVFKLEKKMASEKFTTKILKKRREEAIWQEELGMISQGQGIIKKLCRSPTLDLWERKHWKEQD